MLQIWDVFPISRIQGQKASDPGSATKNLHIFNPKNDLGCLVRIPDPDFFPISDPRSRSQNMAGCWNRIHNTAFFNFCGSFFPSWIQIRFPNADPDPPSQCGSGSSRPKSMPIHVDHDSDLKHWLPFLKFFM